MGTDRRSRRCNGVLAQVMHTRMTLVTRLTGQSAKGGDEATLCRELGSQKEKKEAQKVIFRAN